MVGGLSTEVGGLSKAARGRAVTPEANTPKQSAATNNKAKRTAAQAQALDSDGLPWDERINAPSHTKIKATGRWKLIRQVEKPFVKQVIAELEAARHTSNLKEPEEIDGLPAENIAPEKTNGTGETPVTPR